MPSCEGSLRVDGPATGRDYTRGVPGTAWARLNYPPQFGLRVQDLAQGCGWRVRERADGLWVCPIEAYDRSRPGLIKLTRLANAAAAGDISSYQPVARWRGQDSVGLAGIDLNRVREVASPSSMEDVWVAFRLRFMTAHDADAPGVLGQFFSEIAQQHRRASVWALAFDPRLEWRIASVRVLFGAEANPDFLSPPDDGPKLFAAAESFMGSLPYGLRSFVEPLALTLAPWLTGMVATRLGGAAVVLFGEPIPGIRSVRAPEGLHVLKPQGLASEPLGAKVPEFRPEASEQALEWWAGRLDDLFGMTLDVTRYIDGAGVYQPSSHMGALLSLERLFSLVQATLADAMRDAFVRSTLMFDVIDLLDGMGYESWQNLVNAKRAGAQLHELAAKLPGDCADVLLPRCRTAVVALEQVVDGFRVGNATGVTVPTKLGGLQSISFETAGSRLLQLVRNTTHSFRERVRDRADVALLASYRGDMPDALADLSLLHLLRFMLAPRIPA